MTTAMAKPAGDPARDVRGRVIVLSMVVLQCALLAYFARAVLLPIGVVATSAWALFGNAKRLDQSTATRVALLLAVIFAAIFRVAPPSLRTASIYINSQLAYVVAQYVLVVQSVLLLTAGRRERIPWLVPWLATLGMLCLADVRVSELERSWFQLSVLVFLVLTTIHLAMTRTFAVAPSRRNSGTRSLFMGLSLVAVVTLGWWAASLLNRHERDLEDLISQLIEPAAVPRAFGFSGDGSLSSVTRRRSTDREHVTLRVFSQSEPGYLRGKVFVKYRNREWLDTARSSTLSPSVDLQTRLAPNDTEHFFNVAMKRGFDTDRLTRLECWPDPSGDGTVFLPLHTACFAADVDQITHSRDGVVQAGDLPIGYPYRAMTNEQAGETSLDPNRDELLQPLEINEFIHDKVESLARRLFADCETDSDRIRAVVNYFHDSYEYSPTTNVPNAVDPIGWFILEQPRGHCEFFASAAACLLRLGGVATRYVTGFVVTEKNRFGGYWVARNQHAHAWVEAFDRDAGWVIVEATPGSGQPGETSRSSGMHFYEYLRDGFQTFRIRFAQGGFRWLFTETLHLLRRSGTVGWIALLAWTAVILLRLGKRRRAADRQAALPAELDRLLRRMDKACRRLHLERGNSETLHQFAARIEITGDGATSATAIAKWYRGFASVKYSGGRCGPSVEDLKRMTELRPR